MAVSVAYPHGAGPLVREAIRSDKDNFRGDSVSRYWLAGHRRKAVIKYLRWYLFERRRDNRIRRTIAEAEATQQKAAISG